MVVVRSSQKGDRCVVSEKVYEGRYRFGAVTSAEAAAAKLKSCKEAPVVNYD
jgi:hypothetical protein